MYDCRGLGYSLLDWVGPWVAPISCWFGLGLVKEMDPHPFLKRAALRTTASAPLTSVTTEIVPINGVHRQVGDNRLLFDRELQL